MAVLIYGHLRQWTAVRPIIQRGNTVTVETVDGGSYEVPRRYLIEGGERILLERWESLPAGTIVNVRESSSLGDFSIIVHPVEILRPIPNEYLSVPNFSLRLESVPLRGVTVTTTRPPSYNPRPMSRESSGVEPVFQPSYVRNAADRHARAGRVIEDPPYAREDRRQRTRVRLTEDFLGLPAGQELEVRSDNGTLYGVLQGPNGPIVVPSAFTEPLGMSYRRQMQLASREFHRDVSQVPPLGYPREYMLEAIRSFEAIRIWRAAQGDSVSETSEDPVVDASKPPFPFWATVVIHPNSEEGHLDVGDTITLFDFHNDRFLALTPDGHRWIRSRILEIPEEHQRAMEMFGGVQAKTTGDRADPPPRTVWERLMDDD